jgi:MraZ protein
MDRFVSHHVLRLDAKGRVSVPASFRAVLARDGFDGLHCYPALDRPALDAGGNTLRAEIETLIAGFPPYSEEREQFSRITDAVVFVGLGYKFRMWEPGRFRVELSEATNKIRAFKAESCVRTAAAKPPGAQK